MFFFIYLCATGSGRVALAVRQRSDEVSLTVVSQSDILYMASIYCKKKQGFDWHYLFQPSRVMGPPI